MPRGHQFNWSREGGHQHLYQRGHEGALSCKCNRCQSCPGVCRTLLHLHPHCACQHTPASTCSGLRYRRALAKGEAGCQLRRAACAAHQVLEQLPARAVILRRHPETAAPPHVLVVLPAGARACMGRVDGEGGQQHCHDSKVQLSLDVHVRVAAKMLCAACFASHPPKILHPPHKHLA